MTPHTRPDRTGPDSLMTSRRRSKHAVHSRVRVQAPLHLVRRDLLGRGMLLLHEHPDHELVGQFERLVIERDVLFEDLGCFFCWFQ